LRSEPAEELRRVKRRKGRRNLANFENLPVTTCVHELSEQERACPCCGIERKEIGTDHSWQVEYLPGPLCAKMSETSGPGTITVGRGKKSHFDNHKQDKQFFRCVGSFGA
jgi:hypothetical protein